MSQGQPHHYPEEYAFGLYGSEIFRSAKSSSLSMSIGFTRWSEKPASLFVVILAA